MCWNCGEKGHFKDKCPKPVDKKDDSPKKSNVANAAIKSDSEGDGAFFMEPESSDDEDYDFPENAPVPGGYDNNDDGWFSEVESEKAESEWNTEELSGIDESKCGSLIDVDLDSVSAAEPDKFAAQIGVGNIDLP